MCLTKKQYEEIRKSWLGGKSLDQQRDDFIVSLAICTGIAPLVAIAILVVVAFINAA